MYYIVESKQIKRKKNRSERANDVGQTNKLFTFKSVNEMNICTHIFCLCAYETRDLRKRMINEKFRGIQTVVHRKLNGEKFFVLCHCFCQKVVLFVRFSCKSFQFEIYCGFIRNIYVS